MSTQPSLFDAVAAMPPAARCVKSLQQRFELWIAANPRIVELFLRYAREAKAAGHRHYGIKAITERVRWHVMVQTRNDSFKLNNDYPSRLARLLVERDPQLRELFEFRRLKS